MAATLHEPARLVSDKGSHAFKEGWASVIDRMQIDEEPLLAEAPKGKTRHLHVVKNSPA